MPELPEVETIVRQLNDVLVNREIDKVEVLRKKSYWGVPKEAVGWSVESVGRKAKVIGIYFKGRRKMMIVHLKMTGQLVFVDGEKRVVGGHPTVDWVRRLPSKHTRVVIYFTDGSRLFFNDMRVFGWIKMVDREEYEKVMRGVAPDVTDLNFSLGYFTDVLRKTSKAVKLVLMDQEKIGGVGNIYANDALYLAKVRPDRKAGNLKMDEIKKLYMAVKKVIDKGIEYGGASAANYVDIRGLGGTYQDHFLVYKKDGQPCVNCGGIILKMKIGGRGTFFCPLCQK